MKVLKFNSEIEWLEARKTRITGTRLKEMAIKNPYTRQDIIDELESSGAEVDKKMKKDELDAILDSQMRIKLESKGEQKITFYKLIAERLANKREKIDPMERGHILEPKAIEEFEKETGKKVDNSLMIWIKDDNESIAISPDGMIGETEAVEVKCLSSERHIESYLKNEMPKEYFEQMLQYFIVNEKLETLYFCMYDPSLIVKQLFYFTFERKDLGFEIGKYLFIQENALKMVNKAVNDLTL